MSAGINDCQIAGGHRPPLQSNVYKAQDRIDAMQVSSIARNNDLLCQSCADDDMGINNVACSAACEKQSCSCGIGSLQWDKVCVGLSNKPGETSLPGGITNSLGERRRRNGDPHPPFGWSRNENQHAAITAIKPIMFYE